MSNEIKLGHIPVRIINKLGLPTERNNAYIGEQSLNELAKACPETYLHILDDVVDIIKKPDFVRSDEIGISLIRLAVENEAITARLVTLKRGYIGWYYEHYENVTVCTGKNIGSFIRP